MARRRAEEPAAEETEEENEEEVDEVPAAPKVKKAKVDKNEAHKKKAQATLRREMRRIRRNLEGVRELHGLPGAIIVLTGLVACGVPLRRALRIQPTEALRTD